MPLPILVDAFTGAIISHIERDATADARASPEARGVAPRLRPRAGAPAERWSRDFVHDQLADGRPFRILTVVDQCSRQSSILEAGCSLRGRDVAAALSRVLATGSTPRSTTVAHGTEFTSRALNDRAYARSIALDFTGPGKPTDNGHIE